MTPFLQDGVVSAGEGVRDFDVFVRRAIDYLHRDLASLGLGRLLVTLRAVEQQV